MFNNKELIQRLNNLSIKGTLLPAFHLKKKTNELKSSPFHTRQKAECCAMVLTTKFGAKCVVKREYFKTDPYFIVITIDQPFIEAVIRYHAHNPMQSLSSSGILESKVEIPVEIWYAIFQFVDSPGDLVRLARVCRVFKDIILGVPEGRSKSLLQQALDRWLVRNYAALPQIIMRPIAPQYIRSHHLFFLAKSENKIQFFTQDEKNSNTLLYFSVGNETTQSLVPTKIISLPAKIQRIIKVGEKNILVIYGEDEGETQSFMLYDEQANATPISNSFQTRQYFSQAFIQLDYHRYLTVNYRYNDSANFEATYYLLNLENKTLFAEIFHTEPKEGGGLIAGMFYDGTLFIQKNRSSYEGGSALQLWEYNSFTKSYKLSSKSLCRFWKDKPANLNLSACSIAASATHGVYLKHQHKIYYNNIAKSMAPSNSTPHIVCYLKPPFLIAIAENFSHSSSLRTIEGRNYPIRFGEQWTKLNIFNFNTMEAVTKLYPENWSGKDCNVSDATVLSDGSINMINMNGRLDQFIFPPLIG